MNTFEKQVAAVAGVLEDSSRSGLILIVGPGHRAVDGLHAISRELGDDTPCAWWHLEEEAPSPIQTAPGVTPLLLIHGLESMEAETIARAVDTVLDISAHWMNLGWHSLLWVPPEVAAAVASSLPEGDPRVALRLAFDEEDVPLDLDLEAKRRFAAQVLLTLSYRPLHPLANERFLRAVEDFYVEPRVTAEEGEEDLVKWARSVKWGFLEGPPGGGKSIALAVIALDCARTCSANPVGASLPVFASAGDIASALEAGEDITPGAILSSRGAITWDDPERMQAWLQSGAVLLLLDGIDRVEDALEGRFWSWLKSLHADHPGVLVILSGRNVPIELPRGWVRARLEPFSESQIAAYASQFFALIAPQYRERHATNLLDALERKPWLAEMARHPFHLLSLCLLVTRQGVLPRVRVRVVEFLVESMLSRWEIGGASDWKQRALREQIHDELSQLALRQRMSGSTTFSLEDVEAVVSRVREGPETSEVSAETLLRAPLEAGLVEKTSHDRYSFTHPAFFDYLAVEPIVGDIAQGVSRLAEHLPDRSWDNLVILAAGMAVRRYSWKLPQLLKVIWPEDAQERQALAQERLHRLALALEVLLEAEQDRETLMPWLVLASAALTEHDGHAPARDLAALEDARDRAISRHGVLEHQQVRE